MAVGDNGRHGEAVAKFVVMELNKDQGCVTIQHHLEVELFALEMTVKFRHAIQKNVQVTIKESYFLTMKR